MSSHDAIRIGRIALRRGPVLEYAERGPPGGLPVLLLHGITDSRRSWDLLLPQLPAEWRVIAVSQRGHGASRPTPMTFSTADFAADAAELIETLGMAPALVVGHSMGATNALRLALERPQLLRGWVGIGAFASFGDKPELVSFCDSIITGLRDPVAYEFAAEFQRSTIAGGVPDAFVETMIGESLRVPAEIWRGAFAGLFDELWTRRRSEIRLPALLIWGDGDAYVARIDQQRLCADLPQAKLIELSGVGHCPHWEMPEFVAKALRDFVEAREMRAA